MFFYLLFCLGAVVLCGGIMVPKFYHIVINKRREMAEIREKQEQNGTHNAATELSVCR